MNYIWSHYSEALFDAFRSQSDTNIIVQACPGSGKTTNIRHLCTLAPQQEETIYLAFNKAIVDEARLKLPKHINIMTLNGLGHRTVMSTFGKVTLDDRKVYKLIRQLIPFTGYERNDVIEMQASLNKAIGLLKGMVGRFTAEDFDAMCVTYDLDTYPSMYSDAMQVLEASDTMTDVIDFNDQLRFPIIYDLHMPSYDNVLGDEVQDWNAVQALLVQKLHGRSILVGDRHQSIYGFRGAMTDSMDHLREMFHCTQLPLNLTYRCPKTVTAIAKAIFDDIECLDTAPDGLVRDGSLYSESHTPHDLVICRNNGPLVNYAYKLLHRGIACHMRGRDIGQGLISLINKLGSTTVSDLIDDIHAWKEVELLKAEKKESEERKQKIHDKVESLLVFTSHCRLHDPVSKVITAIQSLFESGKGVCLSTIHKAKGLEAVNVYLLGRDELMPARYATQAWQREQERNIEYVAVTRSKHQLVYVPLEERKGK